MEDRDMMENTDKNAADAGKKEEQPDVELNEDGIPRPAKDPLNWLYTVISLAIFAAGYFGIGYLKGNVFVPYARTVTSVPDSARIVLEEAAQTPLPQGAVIERARISSGTDGDLLPIWYRDIGDTEDFSDKLGFPCGDVQDEQRCSVYRSDGFDEDYVFADLYVSTEDPDVMCLVYEYEGHSYAEFRIGNYPGNVKSVFRGVPKVKEPENIHERYDE